MIVITMANNGALIHYTYV